MNFLINTYGYLTDYFSKFIGTFAFIIFSCYILQAQNKFQFTLGLGYAIPVVEGTNPNASFEYDISHSNISPSLNLNLSYPLSKRISGVLKMTYSHLNKVEAKILNLRFPADIANGTQSGYSSISNQNTFQVGVGVTINLTSKIKIEPFALNIEFLDNTYSQAIYQGWDGQRSREEIGSYSHRNFVTGVNIEYMIKDNYSVSIEYLHYMKDYFIDSLFGTFRRNDFVVYGRYYF